MGNIEYIISKLGGIMDSWTRRLIIVIKLTQFYRFALAEILRRYRGNARSKLIDRYNRRS